MDNLSKRQWRQGIVVKEHSDLPVDLKPSYKEPLGIDSQFKRKKSKSSQLTKTIDYVHIDRIQLALYSSDSILYYP